VNDLFGRSGARLARVPRLRAAYLIRSHWVSGTKSRKVVFAAVCGVALFAALLAGEREPAGRMLEWLRPHIFAAAILAALSSAVMVARRRALTRIEFTRSWLAALPIKSSTARWEALLIDMVPAAAAVAALAAIFCTAAIVLGFASGSGSNSALRICAAMSCGVIFGAILSFTIPVPKPADLPPGSRYVPHPRARRSTALRPSLKALGIWPVRQMFARAQPKMVSRALMPILVMMPLGSTADTAMVVVGLFLSIGALSLLIPAAASVGAQLHRWLAPLPLRAGTVLRACIGPSLAVIVGASAVSAWLLSLLGVADSAATAIGACLAVSCASLALLGIEVARIHAGRR
jgi:hypothetical protein